MVFGRANILHRASAGQMGMLRDSWVHYQVQIGALQSVCRGSSGRNRQRERQSVEKKKKKKKKEDITRKTAGRALAVAAVSEHGLSAIRDGGMFSMLVGMRGRNQKTYEPKAAETLTIVETRCSRDTRARAASAIR